VLLTAPCGGGYPGMVPEHSCEVRLVGKTAGHCDLGQRFIRAKHHLLGALRTAGMNMAYECLTEADSKCASEVRRAQSCNSCAITLAYRRSYGRVDVSGYPPYLPWGETTAHQPRRHPVRLMV
jgi:hypothetical protein